MKLESDEFANVFLFLPMDEDFRIRKYMSSALTIFFQLYTEQKQIFEDIFNKIKPLLGTFSSSYLPQPY